MATRLFSAQFAKLVRLLLNPIKPLTTSVRRKVQEKASFFPTYCLLYKVVKGILIASLVVGLIAGLITYYKVEEMSSGGQQLMDEKVGLNRNVDEACRSMFLTGRMQKSEDICTDNHNITGGLGCKRPDLWQPDDCSMHWYTHQDVTECFRRRHVRRKDESYVGFVGDSRVRILFDAFSDAVEGGEKFHPYHQDDSMYVPDEQRYHLKIGFLWRPYFFGASNFPPVGKNQTVLPDMLVAGCGAWYVGMSWGYLEMAKMIAYRRHLREWAKAMLAHIPNGTVIWRYQHSTSNVHTAKPTQENVTNPEIAKLNRVAYELFTKEFPQIIVWTNSQEVTRSLQAQGKTIYRDWLHLCHVTHEYEVQMLLNLYCNSEMRFGDGTCCDGKGNNITADGMRGTSDSASRVANPVKNDME